MKNYNKSIYAVDDTNLNLIYYETNIKVKNYLNLLFKKCYPVINKPTNVSRNNATIIDYINTNHFLNNDMHSGIVTVDILDHFTIFIIPKDLMLDSRNEPIHITKREVYDIYIACFKTLFFIYVATFTLHLNVKNLQSLANLN